MVQEVFFVLTLLTTYNFLKVDVGVAQVAAIDEEVQTSQPRRKEDHKGNTRQEEPTRSEQTAGNCR